jgi:hypothetical protein
MYDPKTKQLTHISTCFSTHHLMFAEDANNTLWTSGGGPVVGWLNRKVFDETGDEQKSQGWTPFIVDANGNGTRDADEPTATATKAWLLPTSTPGQVTGGGQIVVGTDKVSFGFTAKSTSSGLKGECVVIDHDTKRMIKCRDVTALVQTGNEATIYGNATDDGVDTTYVIHVVDNGDSGRGSDTFSIQTASGYSASGTLTAGNIQAH